VLHCGLSICYGMVLNKAVCALQRDLCQASKLVEQVKHLALGNSFARKIAYAPVISP